MTDFFKKRPSEVLLQQAKDILDKMGVDPSLARSLDKAVYPDATPWNPPAQGQDDPFVV